MSENGYKIDSTLSESSATEHFDAVSMGVVTLTIVSHVDYRTRVVILAHRNGELNEHRILVEPHQTTTTYCALGQVVIVVFNQQTNQVQTRPSVGTVIRPFTLHIT